MRKLLSAAFLAGALFLTSCFGATVYTGKDTQDRLKKADYTATLYSVEDAKDRFGALKLDNMNVKDVVYGEKGKDDDKDIMLAFFFDKMEDAEKFTSDNDHENLVILQRFGEMTIGKNYKEKAKSGTHNNVAYVGTETSFEVCFK